MSKESEISPPVKSTRLNHAAPPTLPPAGNRYGQAAPTLDDEHSSEPMSSDPSDDHLGGLAEVTDTELQTAERPALEPPRPSAAVANLVEEQEDEDYEGELNTVIYFERPINRKTLPPVAVVAAEAAEEDQKSEPSEQRSASIASRLQQATDSLSKSMSSLFGWYGRGESPQVFSAKPVEVVQPIADQESKKATPAPKEADRSTGQQPKEKATGASIKEIQTLTKSDSKKPAVAHPKASGAQKSTALPKTAAKSTVSQEVSAPIAAASSSSVTTPALHKPVVKQSVDSLSRSSSSLFGRLRRSETSPAKPVEIGKSTTGEEPPPKKPLLLKETDQSTVQQLKESGIGARTKMMPSMKSAPKQPDLKGWTKSLAVRPKGSTSHPMTAAATKTVPKSTDVKEASTLVTASSSPSTIQPGKLPKKQAGIAVSKSVSSPVGRLKSAKQLEIPKSAAGEQQSKQAAPKTTDFPTRQRPKTGDGAPVKATSSSKKPVVTPTKRSVSQPPLGVAKTDTKLTGVQELSPPVTVASSPPSLMVQPGKRRRDGEEVIATAPTASASTVSKVDNVQTTVTTPESMEYRVQAAPIASQITEVGGQGRIDGMKSPPSVMKREDKALEMPAATPTSIESRFREVPSASPISEIERQRQIDMKRGDDVQETPVTPPVAAAVAPRVKATMPATVSKAGETRASVESSRPSSDGYYVPDLCFSDFGDAEGVLKAAGYGLVSRFMDEHPELQADHDQDVSIELDHPTGMGMGTVPRVSFALEDVKKEEIPEHAGDYDILTPMRPEQRNIKGRPEATKVGRAVNVGLARSVVRKAKLVYRSKEKPPEEKAIPPPVRQRKPIRRKILSVTATMVGPTAPVETPIFSVRAQEAVLLLSEVPDPATHLRQIEQLVANTRQFAMVESTELAARSIEEITLVALAPVLRDVHPTTGMNIEESNVRLVVAQPVDPAVPMGIEKQQLISIQKPRQWEPIQESRITNVRLQSVEPGPMKQLRIDEAAVAIDGIVVNLAESAVKEAPEETRVDEVQASAVVPTVEKSPKPIPEFAAIEHRPAPVQQLKTVDPEKAAVSSIDHISVAASAPLLRDGELTAGTNIQESKVRLVVAESVDEEAPIEIKTKELGVQKPQEWEIVKENPADYVQVRLVEPTSMEQSQMIRFPAIGPVRFDSPTPTPELLRIDRHVAQAHPLKTVVLRQPEVKKATGHIPAVPSTIEASPKPTPGLLHVDQHIAQAQELKTVIVGESEAKKTVVRIPAVCPATEQSLEAAPELVRVDHLAQDQQLMQKEPEVKTASPGMGFVMDISALIEISMNDATGLPDADVTIDGVIQLDSGCEAVISGDVNAVVGAGGRTRSPEAVVEVASRSGETAVTEWQSLTSPGVHEFIQAMMHPLQPIPIDVVENLGQKIEFVFVGNNGEIIEPGQIRKLG